MSEIKIIKELREKVAISCRIIGNRGVTRGSFGHVSARIPGTKKILIKAKGPAEEALEFAGKRDIIMIDIDGNTLDAPKGLEAPQETEMHLAVFRARPEVMSVIHSHPDWVVAWSPTKRVGYAPISEFPKVERAIAMLSLDNTYGHEEIREFHERVMSGLDQETDTYSIEPKNHGIDWRVPSTVTAPTGAMRPQRLTPDAVTKLPIAHCIAKGVKRMSASWITAKAYTLRNFQ